MSGSTEFIVNGREVRVRHERGETLLLVLRNALGLTGSRFGCGLEQCGACVVLVDGEPRPSCALPVEDVGGRRVTTVEGLAAEPLGRALLRSFEAAQAGQCGYCLSGILVAAFALLKERPRPSRAEIAAALDPHLCRCGAHPRILGAVEDAAALTPASLA